jgi:hypothetical protein
MHSDEEVADTYLRHYELKQDSDFWALQEMDDIVRHDPERGWRLTRLLIQKAASAEALAYVAAGPLEDYIDCRADTAFMDRVAAAARDDERLQLALSGVWLGRSHPIRERWLALMEEFGFLSGRRRSFWGDGVPPDLPD